MNPFMPGGGWDDPEKIDEWNALTGLGSREEPPVDSLAIAHRREQAHAKCLDLIERFGENQGEWPASDRLAFDEAWSGISWDLMANWMWVFARLRVLGLGPFAPGGSHGPPAPDDPHDRPDPAADGP